MAVVMEIHEEFARLRKYMGLTQKEAAELVGVSEGSVRKFEAGETDPRASNWRQYVWIVEKWQGEIKERWGGDSDSN